MLYQVRQPDVPIIAKVLILISYSFGQSFLTHQGIFWVSGCYDPEDIGKTIIVLMVKVKPTYLSSTLYSVTPLKDYKEYLG